MTKLNFDVLLLICGLLPDVQDVLSFSLTCSALHPVAVERRLSMRPVTIDSAKSVRDFHNFLFVDEKRRGKHVRAITIPVHGESPNSSEELLHRLLAIFESVPRIHTLSLYTPSVESRPQSLFRQPRFLAAVCKLPSLHELNVVGPLGAASTLFNLRSPLRMFQYSEICEYSESIPRPPGMAPPTDALVEMEISLEFLGLTIRDHVIFPAVRSLTLTNVGNARPQLDLLLIQFPSLDRAFIINDVTPVSSDDLPVVASRRETNRELVRARKMVPWKALDRVVADPDMLYSLGLDCPVRHLTLGMQWNDNHHFRASADSVRAVLREHTPTHLALVGIRLPHGFSNLGDILWWHPEEAVARRRLTHLFLDATYWNTSIPYDPTHDVYVTADVDASWDAMLNSLLGGLEGLHLTHIRVAVNCLVNSRSSFCAPIYDGARAFKVDRLATTLANTIPSLTHISIASTGHFYKDLEREGRCEEQERWETRRAWRVRRLSDDGGSAHRKEMQDLEELSAEEAEAMIDREEMHATERKKWIVGNWCYRSCDYSEIGRH